MLLTADWLCPQCTLGKVSLFAIRRHIDTVVSLLSIIHTGPVFLVGRPLTPSGGVDTESGGMATVNVVGDVGGRISIIVVKNN